MNLTNLIICTSLIFGSLLSNQYSIVNTNSFTNSTSIHESLDKVDGKTSDQTVALFEKKFDRKVLLPKEIPFKVTDIETSLDEIPKTLTVSYHNKNLRKVLVVTQMLNIRPKTGPKFSPNQHEKIINVSGIAVTYIYDLPDKIPNYVRFIKGDMIYFINFRQFEDANVDNYIKVINSMIPALSSNQAK
ncbi:hypothetical protein [Paenibacillus sp. FSL P2-0136]|uniref:hypothetical protein n=1 Tax=unclassified Paenibacillus TaxID=185978 RepID=UPI0030DAB2BD